MLLKLGLSSHSPNLLGVLASSTFAVSLGIDASSEGVLIAQGNLVDDEDPDSQQDTGGLAVDEGGAEEAHGGTIVHRGVGNAEGEASHDAVHQNAEVVTEERAGNTQLPCRREHENVATCHEGVSDIGHRIGREKWVGWLEAQGPFVEKITENAERKDGGSQTVACSLRTSASELGEDLVLVL